MSLVNGYEIKPGAYLEGAYLEGANLEGANLTGAHLEGAHLECAKLAGANLAGAQLTGAQLEGADLTGAKLPDGRTLPEYIEWLPEGLLTKGFKPLDVVLAAFSNHTWANCPMATAFDAHKISDVPACHRAAAALFIALFDGRHLDGMVGK